MALEIAGFIGQLDENFPGTTDQLAQGDDHIRMLKAVLKATFPGRSGADSRVLVRGASFTPSANEVGAIYACSAALTVSMPALGGVLTGANYIVHASAGNVTLTANGTELLNGVASMTLSTGGWALLAKRSGAEWTVLASFPKQTGAELVAAIGALPVQNAANGGVTSVNGLTGAVIAATTDGTKLPLAGGTMTGAISSTANSLVIGNSGGALRGHLYNDASGFGFLDNAGGWAARVDYGTTNLRGMGEVYSHNGAHALSQKAGANSNYSWAHVYTWSVPDALNAPTATLELAGNWGYGLYAASSSDLGVPALTPARPGLTIITCSRPNSGTSLYRGGTVYIYKLTKGA